MTQPTRRSLTRTVALAAWALFALNGLALVGIVARDRNVVLALLFYLPAFPLGVTALAADVLRRGHSVSGPRFALASLGLVTVLCSAPTMFGRGPGSSPTIGGPAAAVRVLHWNVLWGGRPRTDASWDAIQAAIVGRRPDVVVLSEAPPAPRLDALAARLGPGWSSTRVEHDPGSHYWYKMVVLSRWPIRGGLRVPVRNGTAVNVLVERPGRPLRLLVVDGQSKVTQSRTPLLLDVAGACRRAADDGAPFDAVVGDFNAVERSVGFDAVRAAAGGYELASWSCAGWRGTWPVPVPVYDIDHVWARAGVRVLSCSLFTSPVSDHRGQLVRLGLPGLPAVTTAGVGRPTRSNIVTPN